MLPLTLVLSGCTAVYSAKPALGQAPAAVYVHDHQHRGLWNTIPRENYNGLYIRQRVDKNKDEQHWEHIINRFELIQDSYYASLDCHRGKVYDWGRNGKKSRWETYGYIPKYYIRKQFHGKSENECWNVWYTQKGCGSLKHGDGHYGVYASAIDYLLKQSDGSILGDDFEGEYTLPIRNVADVCKLENMVGLEVIQEWCEKLKNERNGVRDEILDILQRFLRQKHQLEAMPHVNLAEDQLKMWKNMEFRYTGFNDNELGYIKEIIKNEVSKIAVPHKITREFIDQQEEQIKKTVREELSREPWKVMISVNNSANKDPNRSTHVINVRFRR